MSTYQLAREKPWGAAYKITPETTEVELNVIKCFQANGSKEEMVTPQASLPDTRSFQVRTLTQLETLRNQSTCFDSDSVTAIRSLVCAD